MKKPTTQQLEEVKFCEKYLYVEFTGNINDIHAVTEFLNEYLEEAEEYYNSIIEDFISFE